MIQNVIQPAFGIVVAGLGSKAEDICGRDWYESGGDFGDPGELLALSF